ncbi:very short patch repair endonuclease [Burkholderia cepacia]|uniref:very short patch repair endonuclease n=1 Tax=Burkholderia cepacia TaxID=292 RepID=UPI0022AA22B3|nr:very short patch repair endonuclease [Burkholderia cepacia]
MTRSENMRRIRSKNTAPELAVRRLLRSLGYTGYRLHWKSLPGKPDVAFVGRKRAIAVHGCFWHGHECAEGSRKPKSNQGYWLPKIEQTKSRDARAAAELSALGWALLTIWECELGDIEPLSARIIEFLRDG